MVYSHSILDPNFLQLYCSKQILEVVTRLILDAPSWHHHFYTRQFYPV
jgi:hypothetical protein